MRARRWTGLLLVAAACKSPPGGAAPTASASGEAGAAALAPSALASAKPADSKPMASSAPPPPLALARDGGTGCRTLVGPVAMPLKSAAALALRADGVDVVLNDDGKPRTTSVSAAAPPSSADAPAAGYAVPCAQAGEQVFCPDHTGAVHRAGRDGSGDRMVASSRA